MYSSSMSTLRRTALVAALLSALVLVVGADSTRLVRRDTHDADRRQHAATVGTCLEQEIRIAVDDPARVGGAVADVARLIQRRAGVTLDPSVVERLASAEARTLRGDTARIALEDLSAAVAATAVARLRDCTDAEISYAADAFANVATLDASKRPVGSEGELAVAITRARHEWRVARTATRARGADAAPFPGRSIMLRYTGAGRMTTEGFVELVTRLRTRMRLPHEYLIAIGLVDRAARPLFEERLATFAETAPASWGPAMREGLTPIQALVLVYSVASDDPLTFPTDRLRARSAKEIEAADLATGAGGAGEWAPFGPYGQRFSTPLDLVFDAETLTRLLDRVDERSSR